MVLSFEVDTGDDWRFITSPSSGDHSAIQPLDAHILRMPPEILRSILGDLNHDPISRQPDRDAMSSHINHNVISFSHVCQRLRDVSLSFPSLWTTPPLTTPEFAAAFLQRSRQTPLHLIILFQEAIGSRRDRLLESLTESLPYVARLTSMDVVVGSETLAAISVLLAQAMPNLRTLSLRCPHDTHTEIVCPLTQMWLPARPFNGCTPELKSVDIRLPLLENWGDFLLSVLAPVSNLSIGACTSTAPEWSEPLSFNKLLQLLTASSKMVSLTFDNGLPEASPEEAEYPDPESSVILPWLKRLRISNSTPAEVVRLIRHLSLPRLATLDIDCGDFEDHPRDPHDQYQQSMLNKLLSKIPLHLRYGIRRAAHLRIILREGRSRKDLIEFAVALWDVDGLQTDGRKIVAGEDELGVYALNYPLENNTFYFRIRSWWKQDGNGNGQIAVDGDGLLDKVTGHLCIENVEYLYLRMFSVSARILTKAFGASNLVSISVYGDSACELASMLGNEVNGTCAVRLLKFLRIDHVDFRNTGCDIILQRSLMIRRTKGLTLSRLVIWHDCRVNESLLTELRAVTESMHHPEPVDTAHHPKQ